MVEKPNFTETRNLPMYINVVYPKVPGFEGMITKGVHESYNCTDKFCDGLDGNSCCGIRIKMPLEYFKSTQTLFNKRFIDGTNFSGIRITARYNQILEFAEFEISNYKSIRNYEIVKHLSKIGMEIKSEIDGISI